MFNWHDWINKHWCGWIELRWEYWRIVECVSMLAWCGDNKRWRHRFSICGYGSFFRFDMNVSYISISSTSPSTVHLHFRFAFGDFSLGLRWWHVVFRVTRVDIWNLLLFSTLQFMLPLLGTFFCWFRWRSWRWRFWMISWISRTRVRPVDEGGFAFWDDLPQISLKTPIWRVKL